MEHRTLTIVFTDMKGFTSRTSQQSRMATVELVRRLETVLVPVLTARGGRLVKTIGDGFLVVFESPTDAVLAAMELQDTLRRRNGVTPAHEQMEIRVAINTGEVALEANDVLGEAVNLAARVLGVAEPNQIYLTESTYLSMNTAECPAVRIGSRHFKGVSRPVKLYTAVSGGVAAVGWARVRRWRWAWVVLLLVVGGWGLWRWTSHPRVPPPVPEPSAELVPAEAPATSAPEASVTEPVVAVPDPAALEAIAQAVAGDEQTLKGFGSEIVEAQRQLNDWSRELWRFQSTFSRLKDRFAGLTREIPQVKQSHTSQVQQIIDRANQAEDRATADDRWRQLGQFEVQADQWEANTASMASTVETSWQVLKQWDASLEPWRTALAAAQQEIADRGLQVATMKTLTAWDVSLDQMSANLQALGQRIAETRQAMAGLRADLDTRQAEADSYDQHLQSWRDFRDQWRATLY